MSLLANHWAAGGDEVALITLGSVEADFFPLHAGVRRVGLDLLGPSSGAMQALAGNLRRVRRLRRALAASRPQVIVSFMDRTNVLTLLAAVGLGAPVAVTEQTDPWRSDTGRLWGGLRRLLYPRAALVLAGSQDGADFVERFTPPGRVAVIPNPIPPEMTPGGDPPPGEWPDLERTVLGMGRLSPEKGFDILVRAFALCAPSFPDWRLLILGEGPQRPVLEALAADLGVTDKVSLPGNISQPRGLLSRAGMFVMPSRHEGSPCALMEAMACGQAAAASDCSSAVADILEGGRAGLIFPPEDVEALARAMAELMGDPEKRARLARRAQNVRERFGLEAISAQWKALLPPLAEAGGRSKKP